MNIREQSLLEQLVDDNSVLHYDDLTGDEEDRCRYCGCTDDNACVLGAGEGEATGGRATTCSWHRRPHYGLGVCSAPACVKAYIADQGAP